MAAIIEADIIHNEDGEFVQIGDDEVTPFTWIWTAGADINGTAQNVRFYRVGNVVFFDAEANGAGAADGWLVAAAGTAATISNKTGSVVPQQFRPLTTRIIPIAVQDNNLYVAGGGVMKVTNAGAITIGASNNPVPAAFTNAQQPIGFQLRGSYIV